MSDMLVRCGGYWGATELREGTPGVEQHHDVFFQPFNPDIYYANDPLWGVYDRAGRLIEAAAYRCGAWEARLGQSEQRDVDTAADHAPDGTYVYGGALVTHFGHFVCSGLSRLWLNYGASGPKVLFHMHGDIDALMRLPYAKTCLERLGLTRDRIFVPERPVWIRRLIVPRPSLEEQSFVYPAYGETCRRIGQAFVEDDDEAAELGPVYLSKTALAQGVSRIAGEQAIEDVFRRSGAEVVYPEQLSFGEQIRLFSRRRTIAGTLGSAFHTSVFAPPRSRLLCLHGQPTVNANFALIDKVNGNDATYVTPSSYGGAMHDDEGFLTSFLVQDPEAIAREFLELLLAGPPWTALDRVPEAPPPPPGPPAIPARIVRRLAWELGRIKTRLGSRADASAESS